MSEIYEAHGAAKEVSNLQKEIFKLVNTFVKTYLTPIANERGYKLGERRVVGTATIMREWEVEKPETDYRITVQITLGDSLNDKKPPYVSLIGWHPKSSNVCCGQDIDLNRPSESFKEFLDIYEIEHSRISTETTEKKKI